MTSQQIAAAAFMIYAAYISQVSSTDLPHWADLPPENTDQWFRATEAIIEAKKSLGLDAKAIAEKVFPAQEKTPKSELTANLLFTTAVLEMSFYLH